MVDYYVDPVSGNDANAGTSTGAAWQRGPFDPQFTGSYVHSAGNVINYLSGSEVYLNNVVSHSTVSDLIYDVYGGSSEVKMLALAPISGGWSDEGGNVWSTPLAVDPDRVLIDRQPQVPAASAGAVDSSNTWFWNGSTTLYLYATENPDTAYETVEREKGNNNFYFEDCDAIEIRDGFQFWGGGPLILVNALTVDVTSFTIAGFKGYAPRLNASGVRFNGTKSAANISGVSITLHEIDRLLLPGEDGTSSETGGSDAFRFSNSIGPQTGGLDRSGVHLRGAGGANGLITGFGHAGFNVTSYPQTDGDWTRRCLIEQLTISCPNTNYGRGFGCAGPNNEDNVFRRLLIQNTHTRCQLGGTRNKFYSSVIDGVTPGAVLPERANGISLTTFDSVDEGMSVNVDNSVAHLLVKDVALEGVRIATNTTGAAISGLSVESTAIVNCGNSHATVGTHVTATQNGGAIGIGRIGDLRHQNDSNTPNVKWLGTDYTVAGADAAIAGLEGSVVLADAKIKPDFVPLPESDLVHAARHSALIYKDYRGQQFRRRGETVGAHELNLGER